MKQALSEAVVVIIVVNVYHPAGKKKFAGMAP
jgi:hypothetical protein